MSHRTRHPRSDDRFRSLLARWSLPLLLGGFLALLVTLGALVGLGYRYTPDTQPYTETQQHSYWFWFRESVLLLAGLATSSTQQDESGSRAVVQLVGAIGGVMLPALALGIVVFKAFVKDRVFVTRSEIALLDPAMVECFGGRPDDVAKWLAFRLYSSTKLTLVDVAFTAYVRVKGTSRIGTPIVTNAKLTLFKDHWPIALPHIPYTLYAPLRAQDLEQTADGVRLRTVLADERAPLCAQDLEQTADGVRLRAVPANEREFEVAEGCDILLIVTGRVPELGTELVESHWFRADEDLGAGPFGEISVSYPKDRRTWKASRHWHGWDTFDAPRTGGGLMARAGREYVFGYGSLLRRDDGIASEDAVVCHLAGFRRAWDVAMDNRRTIAGYKYYLDQETGERPAIYVAFLNIRPEPGSAVSGVVYAVDASILPLLDERERNYERREVTSLVDADVGGRVWAYVGTSAARRRYETGRAEGTAFVSEDYYEGVRDDFARLGASALDEFDRTTDTLEIPRRALRRIDVPAPASDHDKDRPVRGVI